MWDLDETTRRIAEIENTYQDRLRGLSQFGEPRKAEFGLDLPFARSPGELIDSLDALVRLITAAAALAAVAHPQLGIPVGKGVPRSMPSLLERPERRAAWQLEITQLAAGSIQVGLAPRGRHIKRVLRSPTGLVAAIAALYAISTVSDSSFTESCLFTAAVRLYDREELKGSVILSAGESEFGSRVPLGSTLTMATRTAQSQVMTLRLERAQTPVQARMAAER